MRLFIIKPIPSKASPMKKIFITTAFLFAALAIHSHVQVQKVLIDEDFNTNRNNWLAYTGTQAIYLIYNGNMLLQ